MLRRCDWFFFLCVCVFFFILWETALRHIRVPLSLSKNSKFVFQRVHPNRGLLGEYVEVSFTTICSNVYKFFVIHEPPEESRMIIICLLCVVTFSSVLQQSR